MEFKDVLQKFKVTFHLTNEQIAKEVGVNKSTVGRWLSGDTRVVNQNVIEKLSEMLNLDVETLLNGENKYEKPILGTVKAGYDLFIDENFQDYESVSKDDYYKGDFFLRVTGDSMDGAHIHDQDLIYVKKCNDVPNETIAVILIGGQEVTVKRIIKKDSLLILEAANPSVPSRYFSYQEVEQLPIQIIGKVLYSRSDF